MSLPPFSLEPDASRLLLARSVVGFDYLSTIVIVVGVPAIDATLDYRTQRHDMFTPHPRSRSFIWAHCRPYTLACTAMVARKRPASSSASSGIAKRQRDELYEKLAHCGTKTGVVNALSALQEAGVLQDGVLHDHPSALRRQLRESVAQHGHAMTPYGAVIQQFDLGLPELRRWDYIHPMAFLNYACGKSPQFAKIMADCCTGRPLRLIIYIDEVCPGNPLRPEKSRTLQAIYWAFADWPQWLLQRTMAWPTFGTIRSTLVENLPGKVSGLMRRILRAFFPPEGHSFKHGVSIPTHDGHELIVTATFSGFLCDEKAHNQIAATKGASGTKPCITCKNVFNRVPDAALVPGAVSIRCWDRSMLDEYTNDEIYEAYDYIANSPADQRKLLQQCLGIKIMDGGLLEDRYLRQIYKPIDHTLRDPMHVFLNNGVANVEIAHLWRAFRARGFKLEVMQDYMVQWHVPKRHGKIERKWLSKNRFGKKCACLSSFSGVLLTMIPILVCFLQDVVPCGSPLQEHKRCFVALAMIVGICAQIGPSDAMEYVDVLDSLLEVHGEMFTRLYPSAAKPKFHQALHVPENMEYLGKLLSCFVTERKHRITKRCALYIFRHIDNTVVKDILSRQMVAFTGDLSLFQTKYLGPWSEQDMLGTTFHVSHAAVLRHGQVTRGDMLYMSSDDVAVAEDFWQAPGGDAIVARVTRCRRSGLGHNCWEPIAERSFVDSDDIVDAVTWCVVQGTIRRVIPPARVLAKQLSTDATSIIRF